MNLKVIFLCTLTFFNTFLSSMERCAPSTIQQFWRYGHYIKKSATLSFQHNNENIPGKYPWFNVSFDRNNSRIMVWCLINSNTMLETTVGQIFLIDTLREPQEHSFFETVSDRSRAVKIIGMSIEVFRGYQIFEYSASYSSLCEGVLSEGTQLIHGTLCCIPAKINQEQHLYVFAVNPLTYLADLGAYENKDPLCFTMNSDGSVIVVLSKDATIHVIEIAPHLQRYPLLFHHKMTKLHNCSYSFV